jgi:hypothetical protein
MNDYYSLDFLGKECKNNYHYLCDGQWKGLGFKVVCNCECHRKSLLEEDVRYNHSSNEKDWKELCYKGDSYNDSNYQH